LRADVRGYYETLLCRLPWPAAGSGRPLRTLGVTSCLSGEGVSTVAAHLALAAAGIGRAQVLLADANFSRPGVPRIFGVRGRPGLAELLHDHCTLPEVLQPSPAPNLKLLAAGKPAAGISRAYDAAGLPGLLKELAADFELVVVDLPPAGQAAALRLARLLDGVLLVVEAERVHREFAQRVCGLLSRAGAHPVGVALNKWRQRVPDWLYRVT
jgi:Mrp family chromosome partitioning ATPase